MLGGLKESSKLGRIGKMLLIPTTAAALHYFPLEKPIQHRIEETSKDVRGLFDPTYAALRELEKLRVIDPEKEAAYKRELVKKLEAGENIPSDEFIWKAEEVSLGMTQPEQRNAKSIFFDEYQKLEHEKPDVPTPDFLQKVVDTAFEKGENPQDYALTLTSVTRFFNRKGQPRRGGCNPKGWSQTMLLENLYPERKKDMSFQVFGGEKEGHIRAVFAIPELGKTYALEPGIEEITEENRRGTAFYTVRDYIGWYTGDSRFMREIDAEPLAMDQKAVESPFMNPFTTESFFNGPKIRGGLRAYGEGENFKERWEKEKAFLEEDLKKEREALQNLKGDPIEAEIRNEILFDWKMKHAFGNARNLAAKFPQSAIALKYTANYRGIGHSQSSSPFNASGKRFFYITFDDIEFTEGAIKVFHEEGKKEDFALELYLPYHIGSIDSRIMAQIMRLPLEKLAVRTIPLVGEEASLPDSFLDALDSKDFRMKTLVIDVKKTAKGPSALEKHSLQKIANVQSIHHQTNFHIHNLALNEEDAEILSGGNDAFNFIEFIISDNSLLYSDEVLRTLAVGNILVVLSVNKEQFETYKSQSPWLLESKPGVTLTYEALQIVVKR